MLTWAQWSSHRYQNYNVTNVQQATWSSPTNYNYSQIQYYSVNPSNNPASALIHPQNIFNNYTSFNNNFRLVTAPTTTYPSSQRYYSANINTPSTSYNPTYYKQNNETNNSTMETEKYYQQTRFNDYAVHFRNSYALSPDEVKYIFQNFGEINTYKQTGDQRGLFFVNFKTEEGAINCVKGLVDHPKITLRLNKHYNSSKNSRNDNSNESKKCNDSVTPSQWNNSTGDQENHNRQRKESGNSSDNLSDKRFNTVETRKILDNKNIYDNYPKKINDNIDDDGQSMAANNGEQDVRKNELDNKNNFDSNDLPELVPALKKNLILKNEITKNSINSGTEKTNGPKKPVEIFEAQEVIVANIEENYGTPAILHLLEKYEPICASPIKLSKPHSIRYCHVYFKDVDQAESVERDFDEYEWSENKKLIVLRVNTLAALALTA